MRYGGGGSEHGHERHLGLDEILVLLLASHVASAKSLHLCPPQLTRRAVGREKELGRCVAQPLALRGGRPWELWLLVGMTAFLDRAAQWWSASLLLGRLEAKDRRMC